MSNQHKDICQTPGQVLWSGFFMLPFNTKTFSRPWDKHGGQAFLCYPPISRHSSDPRTNMGVRLLCVTLQFQDKYDGLAGSFIRMQWDSQTQPICGHCSGTVQTLATAIVTRKHMLRNCSNSDQTMAGIPVHNWEDPPCRSSQVMESTIRSFLVLVFAYSSILDIQNVHSTGRLSL